MHQSRPRASQRWPSGARSEGFFTPSLPDRRESPSLAGARQPPLTRGAFEVATISLQGSLSKGGAPQGRGISQSRHTKRTCILHDTRPFTVLRTLPETGIFYFRTTFSSPSISFSSSMSALWIRHLAPMRFFSRSHQMIICWSPGNMVKINSMR